MAIGTDIIHMHPSASGAALGEGSLRDFRYFVSNVAELEGGVFLNCGSAVILPEVFLKAVALSRNRGRSLAGLTTVNLDFTRLYRPQTNVVSRPTAGIGKGYSLMGHHELMIPLLAAAPDHDSDKTDRHTKRPIDPADRSTETIVRIVLRMSALCRIVQRSLGDAAVIMAERAEAGFRRG